MDEETEGNRGIDLDEVAGDGGGPEEGPHGDDARPVVARGGVGGERAGCGLDERAAEVEGAQRRRRRGEGRAHLPVHRLEAPKICAAIGSVSLPPAWLGWLS
uniref:Uncharacterized protein n=1 Tax=Arundo donax TaxID=35708 RepID=A0A0A8Z7U7_ARUDO